jgi:mono/diheme cytochrome c family protein
VLRTGGVIGKVVLGATLVLVLLAGGAFTAIEMRWTRTFDAPYPDIRASTDPEVVARGRYLAYGPAACAYCHVPKSEWPRLDAGDALPLSGLHLFRLPLGDLYSANLTPDADTGIGRRTDGELARILRHGVRADGRAAFPFMEFQNLSDEDLTALVSFLRSQPATRNAVPDHRLSPLGKALMAFAIGPKGPDEAPMRTSPPAVASEARGAYLANSVASCASCHTDRNRRDGSFVGPKFAGGQLMDVAADETKVFVPPNLTPDPETSPIGQWTEEAFLVRFRQGEVVQGSPMPWGAYARMTEDDMRSVFRYLRALPPVKHATGPVMQDKP